MRPVINVTTRRDSDKIQIITNINKDKTRCSFFKTINHHIEMTSDKTYIKEKQTCTSLEKIWDFFSMQLDSKSTRNEQKWQD